MESFFLNWSLKQTFMKCASNNVKTFVHVFLNVDMASNQIVADLNKDNKFKGKNYDAWQQRITLRKSLLII